MLCILVLLFVWFGYLIVTTIIILINFEIKINMIKFFLRFKHKPNKIQGLFSVFSATVRQLCHSQLIMHGKV